MAVISINALSAFRLINECVDSYLIDVRTDIEWQHGIPDINKLHLVSWRLNDMLINKSFIARLKELDKLTTNVQNLVFLCKSGVRSMEAASYVAQYNIYNCYNIIDGFEGNVFGVGWKGNKLPCCLPKTLVLDKC